MSAPELPVHVLYDPTTVDENSNIQRELVVPIGTLRSRSQLLHAKGESVYNQISNGVHLRDGWTLRPGNPNDPRLERIGIYNPRRPGENLIDTQVRSVLRLSAGIEGFRSTQSTSALNARPIQGNAEGMVPSLSGAAQGHAPPANMGQLASASGKDAWKASKPGIIRTFVGSNGKGRKH